MLIEDLQKQNRTLPRNDALGQCDGHTRRSEALRRAERICKIGFRTRCPYRTPLAGKLHGIVAHQLGNNRDKQAEF